MSGDGWDELLAGLDDDEEVVGENEWGVFFPLEVGTTVAGWWRGEDSHTNKDTGRTSPVYMLRDPRAVDIFFFGGRAQLDKKIANAAPHYGDRIAIRREEDGPASPGYNPPWRVRVAVLPGDGTMPPASSADEDEPASVGKPEPQTAADSAADDDIPFAPTIHNRWL
jgi:hypothetical protein